MSFGLPIRVKGLESELELRPLERKTVTAMAPYWTEEVVRYLSTQMGQTVESEGAWYDKVSKSDTCVVWGVFVKEGDKWVHVGNTSFEGLKDNMATSGVLLHRKDYWGRGVVSAAHLARTLYAVEVLNLVAVRSEVFQENPASKKAIQKVGYVSHGTTYHRGFVAGRVQHGELYTWVNPGEHAWNFFWGDTKPPKKFVEARKVAQQALERARKVVEFV